MAQEIIFGIDEGICLDSFFALCEGVTSRDEIDVLQHKEKGLVFTIPDGASAPAMRTAKGRVLGFPSNMMRIAMVRKFSAEATVETSENRASRLNFSLSAESISAFPSATITSIGSVKTTLAHPKPTHSRRGYICIHPVNHL